MVTPIEQVRALISQFERLKTNWNGIEVWSARDLMELFGYKSWQGFRNVIFRAMDALDTSKMNPEDHFIQVNEMVGIGSGATRGRENFLLTRFACYMTSQETDSKSYLNGVYARIYFSSQTRKSELLEREMVELASRQAEFDRLEAREKLKQEEKDFNATLMEHRVDRTGLIQIREEGTKTLFGGKSTEDMRVKLGVGGTKRPIADFLPTHVVLAKALAASLTKAKVEKENQQGAAVIGETHVRHNHNVRQALLDSGVRPEDSEAQEDIKIVEKRVKKLKKVGAQTLSMTLPSVPVTPAPEQEGGHPGLFEGIE